MSSPSPEPSICIHCRRPLPPAEAKCPRCDAEEPVAAMVVDDEPQHGGRRHRFWTDEQLLNSRWAMLAMLFLAAGALGVPVLWKSRAFGTVGKVLLSIAALLYTAAMLWLIAWIIDQSIDMMREAGGW